jgi:hypothetical protein
MTNLHPQLTSCPYEIPMTGFSGHNFQKGERELNREEKFTYHLMGGHTALPKYRNSPL